MAPPPREGSPPSPDEPRADRATPQAGAENAGSPPAEEAGAGPAAGAARRVRTRQRRAIAWIAVVLLLGMWGTWAGPRWNPQPMRTLIVPETSDTSIKGAAPAAPRGAYQVRTTTVSVPTRDGSAIPATLKIPLGVQGLVPGMVFVHGTGTSSHQAFAEETDVIASTGIATLVPQKRTNDYSTTHRDYTALARDYEDSFGYLLGSQGVDPRRSGLYAVSEGCYMGPIIAASNPRVSYVVMVSAPVLPIRTQGALAADSYMRNLGAPRQIIDVIAKIVGQQFEDFAYIDFDVSEYQRRMTMPVLMVYGTNDMSMPMVQAPLTLRRDLEKAGNTALTVRYYKGASHGLKVGKVLLIPPMQDVSDWVNGLPSTAHAKPRVAGARPVQAYMGGKVAPAPKLASGMSIVLIVATGLLLVSSAGLLSLAGMLRRRGRRLIDLRGCGRWLHSASAGICLACVVFVAYIVTLAYYATSYQRNSVVVQGGWLLCQATALSAAWLFVGVPFRWREAPGRLSWPARATMAIGLAGQAVLFLSLAYWGLYPSLG